MADMFPSLRPGAEQPHERQMVVEQWFDAVRRGASCLLKDRQATLAACGALCA